MSNKVISLIRVFLKDTYQNLKIFNKEKNRVDKKSIFFWMLFVVVVTISFFSYKIINLLVLAGQPQIFLNIYFVILTILLMFQIILISTNVLFFSKELECILHMPITSTELLIAKFSVFLVMTYITEGIVAVIPFIIYGFMTHVSFMYFILLPIVLIVFPVVLVSIIGLITILLMSFSKIIKNKNICQVVITMLLLFIVLGFEVIIINRFGAQKIEENISKEQQSEQANEIYSNLGNGFLIINPAIEILAKPNQIFFTFKNISKLFFYDIVSISMFILIGKTVYLRNILSGTMSKSKKIKKINIIKYRKHAKRNSYIIKEFKQLYRNPSFFMQLVLPVVLLIISILIIGSVLIPMFNRYFELNDSARIELQNLNFNNEMLSIIFCILQLVFSMSNLSITAISREGENARIMKYIPLDLYKQFVYKNVLQVLLNIIVSAVMLILIYSVFPKINIYQIALIFICSIFIILINSYLMLIVDLKRPILNWDSEYMLIKKNPNKIFKYVDTIGMILLYLYLGKVLKDVDINISILIQIGFFMCVFFIINYIIKIKKEKIFNNIK